MCVGWGQGVVHQESVSALWEQPLHVELQLGARGRLEVPHAGGTLRVRAAQSHGAAGQHSLVAVTVWGGAGGGDGNHH